MTNYHQRTELPQLIYKPTTPNTSQMQLRQAVGYGAHKPSTISAANLTTSSRDGEMIEAVAAMASRGDTTSWNRKMDNMVKLLASLRPIEEQIYKLRAEQQQVFDEVSALRKLMVTECIHPIEHLVVTDGVVVCKFCERRMVPHGSET